MKSYSSLKAFAKNRDTKIDEQNYSPFYKGFWENCFIEGIPCIAYVVYFNKQGKELSPSDSFIPVPTRVEYFFRFDPCTETEYRKYYKICAKWNNPEWIVLS